MSSDFLNPVRKKKKCVITNLNVGNLGHANLSSSTTEKKVSEIASKP